MQPRSIILALFLTSTLVHGQADNDLPKNIRVTLEYIEAPHELVTEVMVSEHADSGPKLHARMRALVKDGKARVVETSILTTRSGRRARSEAVMEHIYPTEYEPPSLPGTFGSSSKPDRSDEEPDEDKQPRITKCPTAFETRNVGVTLAIEPVFQLDQPFVAIRFTQDMTNLLRYKTWREHHDQWGEASIRFPIYESLASGSTLTIPDGEFGFVGLLTPNHSDGGRDTTRKLMLFIRADVLTIGF